MSASLSYENPTVEAQRPGYCVYVPSTGKWLGEDWMPSAEAKDARIFLSLTDAKRAAGLIAGDATSVPRFNGHCYVWDVR